MTNESSQDENLLRAIAELLRAANDSAPGAPKCRVFSGAAQEWKTPSSDVLSSPVLSVSEVFASAARVAVSLVSVRHAAGVGTEPLHYHSSHVIGVGVRGMGWLRVVKNDFQQHHSTFERLSVEAGDVVLIPRGALHLFECEPAGEFAYIALEISDQPIDYQQHRLMA